MTRFLGGYRPAVEPNDEPKFASNTTLFESKVTSKNVDLRPFCSPVEDQSVVGSCVGNAIVGALEMLQISSGKQYTDLSRLFVYYNARLMMREQGKDAGCYIRLAMLTLSKLGTCPESAWKYDVSKVLERPSWAAYQQAYAHKISKFYEITSTGNRRDADIKMALRAKHCVVFGMLVDDDYQAYSGGILQMPRARRTGTGGHAQLIVGYDDDIKCYIVRNSWGTRWGVSGYCNVPYEYLDVSDANDFWVPTISSTFENGKVVA